MKKTEKEILESIDEKITYLNWVVMVILGCIIGYLTIIILP